jgi:hypothetical protein
VAVVFRAYGKYTESLLSMAMEPGGLLQSVRLLCCVVGLGDGTLMVGVPLWCCCCVTKCCLVIVSNFCFDLSWWVFP